jgi:hypothetical protein
MQTQATAELIEAKKLVEAVLVEDMHARNDDLWMDLMCWRKQGIKIYVDYSQVKDMIKPATLERVRREIQNDPENPRLLPTDPKVLIARQVKQEAIEKYYATNQKIITQWQEIKYGIN